MYDNDLLKIEGLRWLPYIGDLYDRQSKKILIVGESHYESNDPKDKLAQMIGDKKYTRNIIKVWAMHLLDIAEILVPGKLKSLTKQSMFANLHRALGADNDNSTKLWNNLAFYNFVQRPMKDGTKNRPTNTDFTDGWNVFLRY